MGAKIRTIFSVFALIMMALFGYGAAVGAWSMVNWGMLAVAFICCLLIFVRFVYVFNFSYALCAIFNGALIWATRPSAASALIGGAAILYGLRLFAFSWSRTHSESYAGHMSNIVQADQSMPTPAKILLYVMVTWLMTFHLMSAWLVAAAAVLTPGIIIGGIIMLAGTLLEGVADWQKQQAKNRAPDTWVATGVFSRWRHPNYLGEIGLQIGLMVAGLSAITSTTPVITGFVDVIMVVIAPLYITILMISESQRGDDSQLTRYGADPAWREYRECSGSLFPR
jgi:steroid 5-alpha reductase family enzyme